MARCPVRSLLLLAAVGCFLRPLVSPRAFMPSSPVARRDALLLGGSSAALLGSAPALADAQGEPTLMLWRYGPYIANLEGAINSGDLKKVLKSERKFELLNTYWRNKAKKERKVSDLTEQIMIAAEKGDNTKVKALFTEYKAFDNWTEFLNLPPADTTYVGTLQKGMGGGIRESADPKVVAKLNYAS
mmetsp:Transcript_31497/g.71907  ORF Transcript_31497/g.71907 Transcript_31497/m.71907 type:complete len:187 (+) Transcript_31497:49-609(+)|eukprot:2154173-Amphidinium_carterae.1